MNPQLSWLVDTLTSVNKSYGSSFRTPVYKSCMRKYLNCKHKHIPTILKVYTEFILHLNG